MELAHKKVVRFVKYRKPLAEEKRQGAQGQIGSLICKPTSTKCRALLHKEPNRKGIPYYSPHF